MKMKRVRGSGGNTMASVVSQILEEFLQLPNNGLDPSQKGLTLVISDGRGKGEILSVWEIGEIPDDPTALVRSCECGKRLLENPTHLNSRQSTSGDSPEEGSGVTIRIKTRRNGRIVHICGLTTDANEAILVLALVHKNYLAPELGLQMAENSRNTIIQPLNSYKLIKKLER